MKLNKEVSRSIDSCVLCWLATSSVDNIPNVSPKEVFFQYGEDKVVIANIASPQSVKNIEANSAVCLSLIDILIQRGFQLKGIAEIVSEGTSQFAFLGGQVDLITQGRFPYSSVTVISVKSVKPIIAPSYHFFPNITEEQHIKQARKSYGF